MKRNLRQDRNQWLSFALCLLLFLGVSMEVRGQSSGYNSEYFTKLEDGTDLTDPVVNSQYFMIGSHAGRTNFYFLKA